MAQQFKPAPKGQAQAPKPAPKTPIQETKKPAPKK